MPKLKNLAALAAAVEAARRYARSNPDKAAKYLDQAAAFLDKQTKGKYSGQISGVVGKVKSAAGLPQNSRTQGYDDERRLRRARGLRRVRGGPGPADDDGAVDHPAARQHPAHAGRRWTRSARATGPSRVARTSDRSGWTRHRLAPTLTAVVPR